MCYYDETDKEIVEKVEQKRCEWDCSDEEACWLLGITYELYLNSKRRLEENEEAERRKVLAEKHKNEQKTESCMLRHTGGGKVRQKKKIRDNESR